MRRNLDQTVFLAPEKMASLAATALVRDLCAETRGLGGALTTGEKARSTLRLTTLSALCAAEARSASLTWSRRAVSLKAWACWSLSSIAIPTGALQLKD